MSRRQFPRTNGGSAPEPEATELPDIDAARIEAVGYAAETIRDPPNLVWDGRDFRVEVTDDGGTLLCTVVVLGIDATVARVK